MNRKVSFFIMFEKAIDSSCIVHVKQFTRSMSCIKCLCSTWGLQFTGRYVVHQGDIMSALRDTMIKVGKVVDKIIKFV